MSSVTSVPLWLVISRDRTSLHPGERPRTHDHVQDGHNQCGAHNGPHDRKGMAADLYDQQFGQVEFATDPRAEHGPDESKGNRGDYSTARTAGDGLAQCSADRRDKEEND